MPVMRNRVGRRLLSLTAVTVVLCGLASAPAAAEEPSSGEEAITLPPLPSGLAQDVPCTTASDTVAEARSWAAGTLALSRAQAYSRGAGVTVAVVDTGVGTKIPALSGRVTAVGGAGEDCVGHGSFTAGIIAAGPVEGSGVLGAAPEAEVLALAGTDDRGESSPARVAQAIRTAADRDAGVIYVGMALKTGKKEVTAAVAYAVERDALVVAPAAPDALPQGAATTEETTASPVWPAASPGVLSVTDFGPSGGRPEKAPPAYRPDLEAPGGAVVSTGPAGKGHYIGTGSSLAAAWVAGTAALVRAHHPELSAQQVARRLLESAYPAAVPRVDPYAALTMVTTEGAAPPPPRAEQQSAPRLPPPSDTRPQSRALLLAAGCLALVLLVAGAGVVLPLGRARRWLPPGRR